MEASGALPIYTYSAFTRIFDRYNSEILRGLDHKTALNQEGGRGSDGQTDFKRSFISLCFRRTWATARTKHTYGPTA